VSKPRDLLNRVKVVTYSLYLISRFFEKDAFLTRKLDQLKIVTYSLYLVASFSAEIVHLLR
jgi:hypothetical protein